MIEESVWAGDDGTQFYSSRNEWERTMKFRMKRELENARSLMEKQKAVLVRGQGDERSDAYGE